MVTRTPRFFHPNLDEVSDIYEGSDTHSLIADIEQYVKNHLSAYVPHGVPPNETREFEQQRFTNKLEEFRKYLSKKLDEGIKKYGFYQSFFYILLGLSNAKIAFDAYGVIQKFIHEVVSCLPHTQESAENIFYLSILASGEDRFNTICYTVIESFALRGKLTPSAILDSICIAKNTLSEELERYVALHDPKGYGQIFISMHLGKYSKINPVRTNLSRIWQNIIFDEYIKNTTSALIYVHTEEEDKEEKLYKIMAHFKNLIKDIEKNALYFDDILRTFKETLDYLIYLVKPPLEDFLKIYRDIEKYKNHELIFELPSFSAPKKEPIELWTLKTFTKIAKEAGISDSELLHLVIGHAITQEKLLYIEPPIDEDDEERKFQASLETAADDYGESSIEYDKSMQLFQTSEEERRINEYNIRKHDEAKFYRFLISQEYTAKQIMDTIYQIANREGRYKEQFEYPPNLGNFIKRMFQLSKTQCIALPFIVDYILKVPQIFEERFRFITVFLKARSQDEALRKFWREKTAREEIPEEILAVLEKNNHLEAFKK